MPGAVDVEAIRRMWPDVLDKVFTLRRSTWTFVSEHAQVLDYDGRRLRVGISTDGLLATFRRGPHAELVRQALIDVLGVDAQVEGVRLDAAGGTAAAPASAESATPPESSAAAAARSWDAPPAPPEPDPEPEPEPEPELRSGRIQSASSAAEGVTPAAPEPESSPTPAAAPAARGARAPRGQQPDPAPVDDEPSYDDEDLAGSQLVGRPVVEQLLGGRVIDER